MERAAPSSAEAQCRAAKLQAITADLCAREALLAFEGVTVVRAKNRFAEGCDNGPIGGYCDLQLQVAALLSDMVELSVLLL